MITSLSIQNVALIEQVRAVFAAGLNVLTGETGAGKSIIVDSINFLLGERPARDFIRSGASFASVEGIIEIDDEQTLTALSSMGVEATDGQLMLERVMQAGTSGGGKSTCRINGRTVAVGMLKEVSSLLVDVHGQHEHQSLLDTARQMYLLDQFCGDALAVQKDLLSTLLNKYRENERELKSVAGIGNERTEQIDFWRHQLQEIEAAALKEGEEETLSARRNRLGGLEALSENTRRALALLYGGAESQYSALDQVGRAVSCVTEVVKLDAEKEQLLLNLNEATAQLSDVAAELRNYIDELDTDPQELERLEARLDIIYRTKKKHGPTFEAVLKKQELLQNNLNAVENSEGEIKRLKAIKRGLVKEITTVCDALSAARTQHAARISAQICEVLRDLGMPNARFEISVTRKTAFTSDGNDNVDFMISPNPGEPMKLLRRIASGGEMSRIMLAIKTVLADADRIPTVIFDEVDAGISGRTAQQVAEKLAVISRRRQILCITHLPQIAAMADTHFYIEKNAEQTKTGTRTVTSVLALPNEKIAEELARLTGGAEITDVTLDAAREMKALADRLKTQDHTRYMRFDGKK
ncbi:MAG: DNA repair protein RecN [Defluviitaleaceae bacterium]|nr:DNA repair protein RecN [Defluviitaleaceae bacterium]MCL2274330.1 DNA repair protein RecN [Defluviitaleaceae bacterium]